MPHYADNIQLPLKSQFQGSSNGMGGQPVTMASYADNIQLPLTNPFQDSPNGMGGPSMSYQPNALANLNAGASNPPSQGYYNNDQPVNWPPNQLPPQSQQ
jgi:hypothetical protein